MDPLQSHAKEGAGRGNCSGEAVRGAPYWSSGNLFGQAGSLLGQETKALCPKKKMG